GSSNKIGGKVKSFVRSKLKLLGKVVYSVQKGGDKYGSRNSYFRAVSRACAAMGAHDLDNGTATCMWRSCPINPGASGCVPGRTGSDNGHRTWRYPALPRGERCVALWRASL